MSNFLDKGIALRSTLINRLGIPGPPKPSILDGVPIQPLDLGHFSYPYNELADYLDGLASRLPYP